MAVYAAQAYITNGLVSMYWTEVDILQLSMFSLKLSETMQVDATIFNHI